MTEDAAMDDLDYFESDEISWDECSSEHDLPRKSRKGEARRRYDQLMEEKRLKQQLEDDMSYW